MLELHQYPAVWGLPSLSPFCIKVETYLRHHRLPYRTIGERNPARGPQGRMPFLVDGSQVIPDSSLILAHLEGDRKPSAQAVAIQRLIEDSLYFVLLCSRWVDPAGWKIIEREFTPLFPPLLGRPILRVLRNQLRRQALEQGMGAHTLEEIYAIGAQDLRALAELLGSSRYILGTEFSPLDASLYGFLITILKQPIPSPLQSELKRHANLREYCARGEAQWFPEYA